MPRPGSVLYYNFCSCACSIVVWTVFMEETYCVAATASPAVAAVVVEFLILTTPAVVVATHAGVTGDDLEASTAADKAMLGDEVNVDADADPVMDEAIDEAILAFVDITVAFVIPVAELDGLETAESVEVTPERIALREFKLVVEEVAE